VAGQLKEREMGSLANPERVDRGLEFMRLP
jgi:hypothetical protein